MEDDYSNNTNIITKTYNILLTVTNTVFFYGKTSPYLIMNNPYILHLDENKTYNKKWKRNKGLYILIHGLLGSPKLLGGKLSEIIENININSDIPYELILPCVYQKGNCPLEEATIPILNLIENYIQQFPNNPIHIISCSNGSRISAYVESKLRNYDVNIKITSMVGAYDGSKLIDYFPGIFGLILNSTIIEDFKMGSDKSNELLQLLKTPIEKGSRYYEFYTTANDWYIPNINSTQPKNIVATSVKYHELITGYDHVSLGYYKLEEVIENSREFMGCF